MKWLGVGLVFAVGAIVCLAVAGFFGGIIIMLLIAILEAL